MVFCCVFFFFNETRFFILFIFKFERKRVNRMIGITFKSYIQILFCQNMAATVALDIKSLACSIFVLSFWHLYSWFFLKNTVLHGFLSLYRSVIRSRLHIIDFVWIIHIWICTNFSRWWINAFLYLICLRYAWEGVIFRNLSFCVWHFLIFWQPIYHDQRYFCCPSIPLWGYRPLLYEEAYKVVMLSL